MPARGTGTERGPACAKWSRAGPDRSYCPRQAGLQTSVPSPARSLRCAVPASRTLMAESALWPSLRFGGKILGRPAFVPPGGSRRVLLIPDGSAGAGFDALMVERVRAWFLGPARFGPLPRVANLVRPALAPTGKIGPRCRGAGGTVVIVADRFVRSGERRWVVARHFSIRTVPHSRVTVGFRVLVGYSAGSGSCGGATVSR